jgi:DNA primase
MRTLHVTDQELLDSGLAKWRTNRRGESFFSDFFRDQVTIEVRNQNNDVVGFIARANPATQNEHTPKYINTPSTRAYRKGEILFGAELVTSSTTPVIVEGPMDAIAVTLAGDGHAVGVAPSGTALTATQVSILQPHFAEDPVALVALDNDEAGWKAAEKAHDMLTSRGADPRRLRILGECKDPGDMYTNEREWFTQFLQYPDLNPGDTFV